MDPLEDASEQSDLRPGGGIFGSAPRTILAEMARTPDDGVLE